MTDIDTCFRAIGFGGDAISKLASLLRKSRSNTGTDTDIAQHASPQTNDSSALKSNALLTAGDFA